ncbi:glycosyltransferase family A protein [Streptomyces sp. CS131]|uniref:glycosyltransferase family 2 protein n=1 Tax=Streptomyces sp. CS131 TaxID=2162711 RepID=UPI000D50F9D9|nr:glycosyltransferase family A protein [Streptomyces sp. CS131]PVC87137.1 glycosyl transferase [Streptomyces sp. CS131]
MRTPDVTVVVAVYNTMPYLTECLDSLVGQSIGRERLQVVAVDDGSTDDSGAELDRFAQLYPDVFTVVHQPNSGGPAAPSNRALELATGRFVYFIGSDDHLGEEALERMVACADANESDVVIGKMVGTNGRYVHQKLYTGNRDVTLDDSELPFTLANTKLFRRELVEKYGLRFPEDMPVGSDQPFTIEACVRARKISVLSDYTCYYAVKRGDASNITYRANHLARLRCVQRIMEHTAALIPAGPQRDAVFRRHFDWELTKLLQKDFPALDADTRRQVCEGVGALVDAYFTDGLRDGTGVKRRARFGLARSGAVEELTRAIAEEIEHGAPPFLLEGGRAFATYPGFRDPAVGLDDRWYEVIGETVAGRLSAGTRLESADWEQHGTELFCVVKLRAGVTGDTSSAVVALAQGAMPQSADKAGARKLPADAARPRRSGTLTPDTAADGGTLLTARIPLAANRSKRGVRLYVDVAGSTYEIPVRTDGQPMPLARRWGSDEPHRVAASTNSKGRLVITTAPLREPKSGVGARLRRTLSRSKRK